MARLLLALLLLLSPAVAGATETGGGRVDVYADGDIVVVAPSASVDADLSEAVQLKVGWMANILSGATPLVVTDVVSSATTFSDVRHAFDLGLTGRVDARTLLRGGARFSLENDYAVLTTSFGLEREVGNRQVVLSATWSTLLDEAWTSFRDGTAQTSITHRLDAGATLLLGRTTRLRVGLSGLVHGCEELLGCQANTYRYVLVKTSDLGSVALRETHPAQRARIAANVRLGQALGRFVAVHVGYRFYADTWRVLGHTADVSARAGLFGERLLLQLDGRMTRQGAASFHRVIYEESSGGLPRYRTADRELAGLWSWRIGGRVEWAALGLGPLLRAGWDVRVHHTWYRYPTLAPSLRRNAWVIGAGFRAEW